MSDTTTVSPPRYTRTTYKGRNYVALGEWTQVEMLAAIRAIGK